MAEFLIGDRVEVTSDKGLWFGPGTTTAAVGSLDRMIDVRLDSSTISQRFHRSWVMPVVGEKRLATETRTLASIEQQQHVDVSAASAAVGDLYVDDEDTVWRVTKRIDEPVVLMVQVDAVRGEPALYGGVSNENFAGFKRIYRPRVKPTGER